MLHCPYALVSQKEDMDAVSGAPESSAYVESMSILDTALLSLLLTRAHT